MAVWTVDSIADNTTTDEYTTLREAIASASDGDIINFAPSLTAGGPATILLDGEVLTVDENVTIIGPGMDRLTIDAQGESRVFMIDTGVEATISGLTITGGASAGGGGIYTIGDLTLDAVRVTGNTSSGHSGGIFVYGTLTLHASLVNNNEAAGVGGGIYVNDSAYAWIYDSTIDGNEAAGAAGVFGYLQAGDRLLIQGSTISNNHATGIGGGLVVQSPSNTDAAVATLVNTTVSGNTAAYSGGIRVNYEKSHVRLVNSTVAFNQGNEAGGLQVTSSAAVTLLNTIVAENKNLAGTSDSDIANWATIHATSAHNLIGRGGSGGLEDEEDGNIVLAGAETAGLAPLGDYGGKTKTHALLPHSTAINAGDDSLWLEELTWDGRGERYRRKNGADIDIGAVEANVVQLESSDPIAVYGTEGADGIYVGTDEAANDYVALDSVGGYKFLVDIGSASSIPVQAFGGDDAVSIDAAVTKAATIDGGAGDDLLIGGSGDDTIRGGAGVDIIHGGAGADTLYGYLDDYEFLGGDGADTIFAKDGDDTDLIYVEVGSDIYEVDDEDEIAEGLATAPAPDADSWQAIVDTSGNGFGPGWNHAGVDRLFLFDDDPFTLRWVRSDGFLVDFTDFNEPSDRDETASVVTQDGTYYIRTDKFGNKSWYLKAGDNAGALVKQVNRLGVGYEYGYSDLDDEDSAHEITSITVVRPGQLGETYTLNDDDFRITEIVDPFGRVANLTYDVNDRLEEIVLPAPDPGAPTVRPTFSFTYDAYGFLSSVTDADGRVTTFAFAGSNGAGMLTVTHEDTGVRQLLPVTGDVFNAWRSQLDAWAAVIPEFRFKMSLAGMEENDTKAGFEIDQLGRTTAFKVDWNGQLVELTDVAGSVTVWTRNSAGQPLEVTVYAADASTVPLEERRIVDHTEYVYDEANFNLLSVTYFDGSSESWTYDEDFSQVTEHIDPLGRRTAFEVDEYGNTIETRIIVGLDDRESSEHDDVVTAFEFTADGLVERMIQFRNDVNGDAQLSLVTEYAYTDVDDDPVFIGRWLVSITYGGDDPETGGISLVNPSSVTVVDRNAFGMPIIVSDELERETEFEYDDLDRVTKIISPDPGGGQDIPVVQYAYLLSGLVTDVTRTFVGASPGEEIVTHFEHDDNGRVEHLFADYGGADEAETVYTHDLAGNIVQVTNALLQNTYVFYDVLNRPVRVTQEDPDGVGPLESPVTFLAYDTLGRTLAAVDPVGQIRRREYDPLGRLVATISPLGVVSRMRYDAAGQMTAATDPMGRVTYFGHDDAGRLVSMLEPAHANPTTYQFDSANNLRFVLDPLTHATETIYDERFRVTEVVDANGDSTLYTYTDANELETLTDGALNTTTWARDGAGRVASETNELSDARTFKYDGFNRLIERIDRNGRTVTYEYDRLDYLDSETWWVGETDVWTIDFEFNALGYLTSITDYNAAYAYTYDALNRETHVGLSTNFLSSTTVEFAREYDAASRMTETRAALSIYDDFVNTYTHDALGRVVSVVQTDQNENAVASKRVDFAYERDSALASMMRYAGTTTANPVASTEFGRDAAGRLTSIYHLGLATGSTFEEEHAYGFDDANRLISYDNLIDAVMAEYGYDDAGQITSAEDTNDVLTDEVYDFDANGNRDQDITNFAGTFDYVVGPNNRLAFDGTHGYLYDLEGNRTAKFVDGDEDGAWDVGEAGEAYTWDHRNRLVQVDFKLDGETVAASLAYAYDAFNQLIARVYVNDGGLEQFMYGGPEQMFGGGFELLFGDEEDDPSTVFIYDRGQVVYQFDVIGDGGFSPPSDFNLSHRYLWGPDVDQLLADEPVGSLASEGEVLWAMADHLGSVRDVIDSNADLRIHRQFDTFGNIVDELHYDDEGDIVVSGPGYVTETFAFTGRWRDDVTGLQNNLNRWYDSETGSWPSEDPIGFAAGDPNLRRYANNRPVDTIDPNGLQSGYDQGMKLPVIDDSKTAAFEWMNIDKHLTPAGDPAQDKDFKWSELRESLEDAYPDIKYELEEKLKDMLDDIRNENPEYLIIAFLSGAALAWGINELGGPSEFGWDRPIEFDFPLSIFDFESHRGGFTITHDSHLFGELTDFNSTGITAGIGSAINLQPDNYPGLNFGISIDQIIITPGLQPQEKPTTQVGIGGIFLF